MGVNAANPAALALTLARDRDRAFLFRDLATLRTNVPLFDSVDDLHRERSDGRICAARRAARRRRDGRSGLPGSGRPKPDTTTTRKDSYVVSAFRRTDGGAAL